MLAATQVAEYSCGADANFWIERWFGDCVYTTWDTTAFFIGLSSVCFWLIAQLPQFISNFIRSAADALSPWFLAQWLAGDTFNFLGCILTGDQLKTQIITAGYFILSDTVIMSQYVYYLIRNRKAIDFDESVHKGSAYSDALKGSFSRDSDVFRVPASGQNDVVSMNYDSKEYTLGSSSGNINSHEPSNCMQTQQVPFPQALPDLRQQEGWMYEHRHRLRRLAQEYNLEYGSKGLTSLYSKQKEKYKNNKPTKALEKTASSNKTRYKAVLGIAGFFGIVLIPKLETFLKPGTSQVTERGFALGRRALLALHDAGGISIENSVPLEIGQPAAAYFAGNVLFFGQRTYPWTMIVGRFLGWASSALYLGSRLSQLVKNKQRQSADGLSLGMLTCAVLGNITYGASIIMRGSSWDNLIGKAPWLVGSFGTVFLDFSIFVQAHYYGRHSKKGDPNEYTPLLS